MRNRCAVLQPHTDTLAIILELAALLDGEQVRYCQWKGASDPARWRSGGDIDLLVEYAHANRFRSCAARLDLKLAVAAAGPLPGIESYLGFDRASGRIVHFHVYYRLLAGAPQTTLFALPLERPLLESARRSDVFPAPRHELELITVALHRLLSERLLTAVHRFHRAAPADVARLQHLVATEAIAASLRRYLPELSHALLQRCVSALTAPRALVRRAWLRRHVRRALRAHAVPGSEPAWRQIIARYLRRASDMRASAAERKRLATGGLIVALVGGDGAGKSTCAAALDAWLAAELATAHFHLGRPRRSLRCLAVGGVLRLVRVLHRSATGGGARAAVWQRVITTLEIVRGITVARDRYHVYERARRYARRGWVVFCERYPIPQNRLLVGPRRTRTPGNGIVAGAGRRGLVDRLLDREAMYYERMAEPDVVVVLRLAPELAVQRKPQEPSEYVRHRSTVIWETDWSRTRAIVIDAAPALPLVISTLKEAVWRQL